MRMLRDGLFDTYTLYAKGKQNLVLCDEVMESISSWITIVSINVVRASAQMEKAMTIIFKRNVVWKIHFERKKGDAELLRNLRDLRNRIDERNNANLNSH
mmetsp:Transcript_9058/g.12307  ORF Transcript_9058/g.12307 Transcript_9058/m.12307 type:complete len:100 (+) Transcript_9058:407-706(+)